MASEEHVNGAVCDAFIGVGGDVVQDLGDGDIGVFSCTCWLGADVAEGHKEFVVDGTAVPQEGTYNTLDAFDTSVVKKSTGVCGGGVLYLGAALDGSVLLKGKLGFGWCSMTVLDEEVSDVAFNGEATRAFGIVPYEVDTGVFFALPVFCDGVMLS